ncbi:MAG: nucleotidyltransferase domain-containing protein [Deltaproteobacteria bacterium]|nr:nucleotidyltransferase domain-containing protein [Deltaproteobacteria bacterium]
MHPHHQAAVEHVTELLRAEPEVHALLLGGSIAHGFERPDSDVDLLIVVSDAEHAAREREGRVHYWTDEGCGWSGGYAEGKYVSLAFLDQVAQRGSEPARFAFQDARVLFSRVGDLGERLAAITRYPVEEKVARIRRFRAQFEAWHWYAHEALKQGDRYLLGAAVARTLLFAARMLLAHNERLYPYHKWVMRVLGSVPDRPGDLFERIAAVHVEPSQASLLGLWACITNFRVWEGSDTPWNVQFMRDSELGWLEGPVSVEDL